MSTPEEQLAAWLFNKFLSEPEQQAMWASSTGYFPHAGCSGSADGLLRRESTYEKAFFMFMDYGIESPVAGTMKPRSDRDMLTSVLMATACARSDRHNSVTST